MPASRQALVSALVSNVWCVTSSPTITTGAPERMRRSVASGSWDTLASVKGLMLPSTVSAPPIIVTGPMRSLMDGSFSRAAAMFVEEPVGT